MTDSQRAAARDLFKEGDVLQRSGKLVEALDKFQRAQAVFDAPTNLLRIAECEAALGRLVESAEAFRAVLRAQLPAGAPPAFQAAMDQARAELAQVEPRVPRLTIDVQPAKVPSLQLQIDGQSVSTALVGAPMPLDPGSHKIAASAPGYTPADQQIVLREQESKTVSLALKAAPPSVVPPASVGASTAAGTVATGSAAASPVPPPPPPVVESAAPAPPKANRPALLLGAHIGWDIPSGKVPVTSAETVDMKSVGGTGLALGLDGGVRFARQWYGGLSLEHVDLGGGSRAGLDAAATNATSNTTALTALIGLVVAPEKPSFYGHLGLTARWYEVKLEGEPSPPTFFSGEAVLGAGLWIPSGRHFVVLPEATLNLGTFNPPDSSSTGSAPGHVFVMLGVAGFYSADL